MRNEKEMHKEVKRSNFYQSIDEKTASSFVNLAKCELMKAEARSLLMSLPKEKGYTFIPNSFLEKLIRQDFSVRQFNEILSIFRRGGEQ